MTASMCWRICRDLVVKEVHGSGGYGMLVGPKSTKEQIEDFRRPDQGRSGQLHRAADAGAVDLPDLCRGRRRAAPCRSAALLPGGRADRTGAGRADAGGAEGRVAGGELVAGRRRQGHLGTGGVMRC